MKTRRMAIGAVMAAALLASPYARAATTNEVDVAALVAASSAGLSETNTWSFSGLTNYNANCIKFDHSGDWLQSPAYGKPIARIEAYVRCSATNNATRWLYVVDAKTGYRLWQFNACKKKDTLENQFYVFAPTSSVDQVRLLLDGSGQTGVWGLGSLTVVAADPADAPSNLCVSRNGGDWCRLSWENGDGTVSNHVETFSIERGKGETRLFETGFDAFYGNTTSARDFSGKISEILGAVMSGVRVYGARDTKGICQTGTADELGILRHSGFADYRGIKLRMSARRLSGCQPQTMVACEFEGTTNVVDTVTLTDEFEDYEIDLSSVTNGAAILLGYWTPSKSNRSVQIDSLSFVRTGTDALTPVDSRWIPATQGAVSFSTRDHEIELLPKSEYRFEVRAQNADGLISDPAAVDVVLDSPPGFRFILR